MSRADPMVTTDLRILATLQHGELDTETLLETLPEIKAGTLRSALQRMVEEEVIILAGHLSVEGRTGRPLNVYEITKKGTKSLTQAVETLRELQGALI